MPSHYRPWSEGFADMRSNLHTLDQLKELSRQDKRVAAVRMREMGFPADQPVTLPILGKSKPLLAIVNPTTLAVEALVRVD
jgi:hypothetical protein